MADDWKLFSHIKQIFKWKNISLLIDIKILLMFSFSANSFVNLFTGVWVFSL